MVVVKTFIVETLKLILLHLLLKLLAKYYKLKLRTLQIKFLLQVQIFIQVYK